MLIAVAGIGNLRAVLRKVFHLSVTGFARCKRTLATTEGNI